MKKIINFFINKPIYLVFIFILILYLPAGLSAAPEGIDRQHASTIGLDLCPEGIELSILSFVSEQSETFARKYLLISTKAENISKALDKIANISGRKVAITHTTTIIISQELAENGAEIYLDYFYRSENLSNDTYLICTKGSAKELLQFEKERVNSTGVGLEEMVIYNSQNWFFLDTNIESYYKGYFSEQESSTIAFVEIEENNDNEQLGNTSASKSNGIAQNSSAGGGSSSSTPDKIRTMGKLGVIKKGKLVTILDEDMVWAMSIINPKTRGNYMYISNYSDENIKDSTIVFTVEKNNVSRKAFFDKGKPVIEFNNLVFLSIDEILSNSVEKTYFYNTTNFLTEKLKNEIESKGKQQFANFLDLIISYKTDIIGAYNTLFDQQNTKFLEWYENLEDKESFLEQIEFRMTIHSALTN